MNEEMKGKNVRVREGQWHYRFNFRGREYSGPTGLAGELSNRSAAERYARDRKAELSERKPMPASVAPRVVSVDAGFGELARNFLAWCKDVEYRDKPNTAERIRVSFVSALEFFGDAPVRSLTPEAIERYKETRLQLVRPVTVRHDLHALSVFFRKYAVKRGMVPLNPVDQVSIPSDRDAVREHVITLEEEGRYFGAASELHALYIKSFKSAMPNLADVARIILEQGPRPEEVMAARKEHFDPKAGTLRIAGGKTRAARRTLILTAASRAILERRLPGPGVWLFPSDRNPGHHITKLACTHDRVCIEAGVSFVLYDFRHTFATRAIEAGVPVAVVAAILGHSGLRTIHRYVHPTWDAQQAGMHLLEAANEKRRAG